MDTADPTPEKETDTKTGELAQIPEETKRKKKHHHHKKEESSCSSEEKSEEEKTKPKEKIVIKDLIAENLEDKLERAFKIFDKDGNGRLSVEEIKEVFRGDKKTWKKVIEDVDLNKDGEVDFKEFKLMMTSIDKKIVLGDESKLGIKKE